MSEQYRTLHVFTFDFNIMMNAFDINIFII
jgi:hypothetical protein